MNIFQKISKITAEMGVVQKNLNVAVTKNNGYKAVSERDVLDAVKPLEDKYGIYSYPFAREIESSDTLTTTTTYGDQTTEKHTFFIRVKTTYRFVNIDDPKEYIDTIAWGDGIDSGDKSVGKAVTYSDKYALMKMYKISTGDDPDQEASKADGYKVSTAKKATMLVCDEQLNFLIKLPQDYQQRIINTYKVNTLNELSYEVAEKCIKAVKAKEARDRGND